LPVVQRGAFAHAIYRTKVGRNTKLHAVSDGQGRPCIFFLTAGNAHDAKVAQARLDVWSQGIVVQCITTSGGTSYGTDSSRQRHDD
jgi:hypothetical protein